MTVRVLTRVVSLCTPATQTSERGVCGIDTETKVGNRRGRLRDFYLIENSREVEDVMG